MLLVCVLLGGLLAGCASDSLRPVPPAQPSELYWRLELSHRAVVMAPSAPYDTLTLTAVPRNYRGEPLTGLPAPTYSSSNPDVVAVTPEGMLIAKKSSAGTESGLVTIVATVTADTLTHTDVAAVQVLDGPPSQQLASLSIHPLPPDSAKSSSGITAPGGWSGLYFLGWLKFLNVRAVDDAGAAISDLPVALHMAGKSPDSYSPEDVLDIGFSSFLNDFSSVLVRNLFFIIPQRPGTDTLYASTTYFGVTKADTLVYRVGWPIINSVPVAPAAQGGTFQHPEVRIGAGGVVLWYSEKSAPDTTEIRFADPAHAAAVVEDPATFPALCDKTSFLILSYIEHPEIPINALDCTGQGDFTLEPGPLYTNPNDPSQSGYPRAGVWRRFPVPGTYEYTNARTGARGRVIVVDER